MNLKLFVCLLFLSQSIMPMQYPVAASCPEIKIEIHPGKLTPKEIVPTDIIEDSGKCFDASSCDCEFAPSRHVYPFAFCSALGCVFGVSHPLLTSAGLACLAGTCTRASSVYAKSRVYIRKARYDKYVQLMEEGTVDQYTAALIAKQYWPEREKRN